MNNRTAFSAHGSYTVDVNENRLRVDARGPFNKEIVVEYERDIQRAIRCLTGSRWSQVICLYGLSMFTPDAEKKLEDTVLYRKKCGLFISAIVLIDVEGSGLVEQQMRKIYKRANVDAQLFSSVEEAEAWLDSQPT